MYKTLQERASLEAPERRDDNADAISARLRHYKYSTLPVIAHYDDQDKLYIVSCAQKLCIVSWVPKSISPLPTLHPRTRTNYIESWVIRSALLPSSSKGLGNCTDRELTKLNKHFAGN